MAINAYTGLMGSGKSYEVVSSVIVPAIAAGRRVVTNIAGIKNDLVRQYVREKLGVPEERLGHVEFFRNEDVMTEHFFPTKEAKGVRRVKAVSGRKRRWKWVVEWNTSNDLTVDARGWRRLRSRRPVQGKNLRALVNHNWWWALFEDDEAFVQGGDLVCVDEAWQFWGTGTKIPKSHFNFFRYHRHFIDVKTKVSCDLAVIVQDINDLHRSVKSVIEMSFRTEKVKSLGLAKVYNIQMWQGYRQTKGGAQSVQVKKYNKDIFPLYQSYAGGVGKEVVVDGRQNLLKRPIVFIGFAAAVAGLAFGGWGLWRFFHRGPVHAPPAVAQAKLPDAADNAGAGAEEKGANHQVPVGQGVRGRPAPLAGGAPSNPELSNDWRIVGAVVQGGERFVVLRGGQGQPLRLEPAGGCYWVGSQPMSCQIDSQRVTRYSGSAPVNGGGPGAVATAAVRTPALPLRSGGHRP